MSIEKNFEKEKIEKLSDSCLSLRKNKYQAWCSELVSEYQKSSLQHLTIVFTLNVILSFDIVRVGVPYSLENLVHIIISFKPFSSGYKHV